MRVLIYGFGRMGLTHFSILNALNPEMEFSVIEPNKMLRALLNKNISARFYKDDSTLKRPFDLTLITTPPFAHLALLEKSKIRGDKNVFIEKPFGGYTNFDVEESSLFDSVSIGYVLRFNPCIQWIKSNINPREIKAVRAQYLSNTIEKRPAGWRNGVFSGVLNEMGSHIIDLIHYITGDGQMDVIRASKESVVSDVDDVVEASLISSNGIFVTIYLNWVKRDVRKPVFRVDIEMKSGITYCIDQQQINKYNANGEFIEKIATTGIARAVPFYLRGVDFTDQILDLLGDQNIIASLKEALAVNRTMEKIISNESNTRR